MIDSIECFALIYKNSQYMIFIIQWRVYKFS